VSDLDQLLAELSTKAQATYQTRKSRAAMRCALGGLAPGEPE